MQSVYKRALESLGFKNIEVLYDIPEDGNSDKKVTEYLEKNNVKDLIAVNLFGAGKTRKFNLEKSLELLGKLKQSYPEYRIILLDSPRDRDALDKVTEASDNILYYDKSETIFDSIAIIKKSEIIVSPDTSIVHIGAGLRKKVIAFYSTNKENFDKWGIGPENKIIRYDKDINEIDFNKEGTQSIDVGNGIIFKYVYSENVQSTARAYSVKSATMSGHFYLKSNGQKVATYSLAASFHYNGSSVYALESEVQVSSSAISGWSVTESFSISSGSGWTSVDASYQLYHNGNYNNDTFLDMSCDANGNITKNYE